MITAGTKNFANFKGLTENKVDLAVLYIKIANSLKTAFFCLYNVWEQKVLFWLVYIAPHGYAFILIGTQIFQVV